MSVVRPIPIQIPDYGVCLAESIHSPDFHMGYRSDPFHKLLFVYRGAVSYYEKAFDEPQSVPEGGFFPVPMETTHRLEDLEPATLFLLCLSKTFVGHNPDVHSLWNGLCRKTERLAEPGSTVSQQVEQTWRRLLAEQTYAQLGYAVLICSEVNRLLVMLGRFCSSGKQENTRERVSGVLAHLKETFYEPWNLDLAADRAQISRRRFSQIVKEVTGKTFLQILTEYRLSHAAQLLRNGNHTVIGAAFSSGFEDLSHFYRLFRKHYGSAPGIWLAAQRNRAALP